MSPGGVIMKTKFLIACLAVLLLISLGAALAAGPGDTGVAADQAQSQAARPISAAAAGTSTQTFWSSGTDGFLRTEPASPGTVGKQITAADITIPAGATAKFVTPLDLPSVINGRSTSVRRIFLEWNGSSSCTITNVQVFSGFFFFGGAGGFPTNFVGTGNVQDLNVDLGSSFPVAHGLAAQWSIHNSAGSPQLASIYAFGARIRY